MNSEENRPNASVTVGDDSVGMHLPPGSFVGARSVVIGATDSRGNTVLTGTMAVGHGARASLGTIAIGAGAGAGLGQQMAFPPEIDAQLQAVVAAAREQGNARLEQALREVADRLAEAEPERKASRIMQAWEAVKAIDTVGGAHDAIKAASTDLMAYLQTSFG